MFDQQVDLTARGLGDASTARVLVAPRPPTDEALMRKLPTGVAVDFVPRMMNRKQLRDCASALAKYLKKAAP